jgi:hypothetical protein
MFSRGLGSSRFAGRDRGYFKSWSFREVLAVAVTERETEERRKG